MTDLESHIPSFHGDNSIGSTTSFCVSGEKISLLVMNSNTFPSVDIVPSRNVTGSSSESSLMYCPTRVCNMKIDCMEGEDEVRQSHECA